MKKLGKALLILLGIIGAIGELLDVLFIPVLFLILGLLQQAPWQYYAILIGGYFAVLIVLELFLRLVFKLIGKKYSSRFVRKVENIIFRFSKVKDNSTNLPTEHN